MNVDASASRTATQTETETTDRPQTQARVMNLAQLLAQTARRHPDAPGVIEAGRHWSWAEIDQRVNAMVSALRGLGVQKGERILVQSRNRLALFESCWVAFRLGCVWVPTNYRLTPPEVAYLGAASGATVMLAEPDFGAHVDAVRAASPALRQVIWIDAPRSAGAGGLGGVGESATGFDYETLLREHLHDDPHQSQEAQVDRDDPLWFFYTSGTTGRPKAAILTHAQMAFVVTNHLADLIPGTTHADCSIAVAPLSHGAGIHALLNVARGAATVLPAGDKLDPETVWRLIEAHRVTNLFTVPTIVKMLVEHPAVDHYDHSSLRYVIYAGAPMYRAHQLLALRKLGKVLVQYFGLGEVTGCITVLPTSLHALEDEAGKEGEGGEGGAACDRDARAARAAIGSCGYPRTGMQVAILDAAGVAVPTGAIGEICCRGPAVFAGYHANPSATAQALRGGWFHTGDLGRLDARGLLFITGRESDMYISGGSNVYPREVEEVLLTHAGVAEVAVLGVADAKWGEIGIAVVVRRAGAAPFDAADLLRHLDGRSARYRWPSQIFFWDALPKSAYGKITKKDILSQLVERGEVTVATPH